MKYEFYMFRVTIPLSWTADPQMVWQPQVSGILGIKLKSVKGLPRLVKGLARSVKVFPRLRFLIGHSGLPRPVKGLSMSIKFFPGQSRESKFIPGQSRFFSDSSQVTRDFQGQSRDFPGQARFFLSIGQRSTAPSLPMLSV